jgi:hypothetical protein
VRGRARPVGLAQLQLASKKNMSNCESRLAESKYNRRPVALAWPPHVLCGVPILAISFRRNWPSPPR